MIAQRRAPERLFRVGYGNEPSRLPDWQRVGANRFDDPQGAYRVLYMSESPMGAFIERFQDFRRTEEMAAIEADFEWEEDDESQRTLNVPSGTVPFAEYSPLSIGSYAADIEAILLDLTKDETAREFAMRLAKPDLTVAKIAAESSSEDYATNRAISRLGYEHEPPFAGIYSVCKLHPTGPANVTAYEGIDGGLRLSLHRVHVESVSLAIPELKEAAEYLGIALQTAADHFTRQVYLSGP